MNLMWEDGQLVLVYDTQTPNDAGGLDIEEHGRIQAPPEWWVNAVLRVLGMVVGRPGDDVPYALCPADTDAETVGELVGRLLQDIPPWGPRR